MATRYLRTLSLMSVPRLEHFLGRRPILVADLAGAEDMAAAPASFDVFGALEQPGVFGALFVDAAHLRSVGGDVTAAAALRMAQHDEEPARDVDHLRDRTWFGFFQDWNIAVFRREATMPAKVGA